MKGLAWLLCANAGLWMLIGAPISLIFHVGAVEALVVAVAGLGLVAASALLLFNDVLGPRQ